MIVKVQRQLYPTEISDRDVDVLIYDKPEIKNGETRYKVHVQLRLPKRDVTYWMGSDLKGYFQASIMGTQIVLMKRVADQDW